MDMIPATLKNTEDWVTNTKLFWFAKKHETR